MMNPRVLILTSNSYRKVYFANEISKFYQVSGIVVEQKFSTGTRCRALLRSTNYNPVKLISKAYYKMRLCRIDKRYKLAEINMLLRGDRFKPFPKDADILKVDNINSLKVADFIRKHKPDIILVFGTSLISKGIINLAPPKGIVNMHTGLSPYYRGGPCTFWCIANEELEHLGVTIHYLTTGIDSGDIILSEREVVVEPCDNEATLDCKIIMRGTKLMIEAIKLIFCGNAPRVPQWQKGKFFLYKYFTPQVRLDLERRLRNGLIRRWLIKNKDRSFTYIKEVRPNNYNMAHV